MKNLPQLKTKRLILRELSANDIPTIVKYANSKNISDTTTLPFPYQEKDAIYWINMAHQGLKLQQQS